MRTFVLTLVVMLTRVAKADPPCLRDDARASARSAELAALVRADQDDRRDWSAKTADDLGRVAERDLSRRKRVGEIFGEGCFSKAADFAAAALIYQHGDSPDHFYQTFIWSKRAVDLGDQAAFRLMALGLDRYLVSIGQRQLLGSQAVQVGEGPCWCLRKVERSFPDARRRAVVGKSLSQAFAWVKDLNSGHACPNVECDERLKATPRGFVPGYW